MIRYEASKNDADSIARSLGWCLRGVLLTVRRLTIY